NDYGKDFMNRCDVSVYIVPFDSLILTLWFFILRTYANNSRNTDFHVGTIHEHWCQLKPKIASLRAS
ncbi:hypothetical protein, partial [Nostoc sp. KVJ20]|uniref:hypothetical protein n=1 Tax=Nostoc sp. KVJ20 TaxID=457944 RepID=UPI001C407705